jgi:hypothetical protein
MVTLHSSQKPFKIKMVIRLRQLNQIGLSQQCRLASNKQDGSSMMPEPTGNTLWQNSTMRTESSVMLDYDTENYKPSSKPQRITCGFSEHVRR